MSEAKKMTNEELEESALTALKAIADFLVEKMGIVDPQIRAAELLLAYVQENRDRGKQSY